LPTTALPLYGAELLNDAPLEAEVYLVEGEKAADALRGHGLLATATVTGAKGTPGPEALSVLYGRRVFLWPDHDEVGCEHMERIARELAGFATSVRRVFWGEKPSDDAFDYFARGGSVEGLASLVSGEHEFPTVTPSPSSKRRNGFVLTSASDFIREPEEETRWLVDGMFPSGGVSLLAAKPKVGKSTLARQLAVCVARGEPFLGRETSKGPVVYLALEEKRSEVRAHFRAMGVSDEEIHIHVGSAPENAVADLRNVVERIHPVLVIVDPLFRMTRVKDTSAYAEVLAALEPLLSLARDTGAHVLAVHHSGKGERSGGDSILGSTAILGTVDTAILMKRSERYRTVWTLQRYGTDLDEAVVEFDREARTVGLGEGKKQAEEHRLEREIEELLQNKDRPLTEEEVLAEVEGKTGTKRKALRELVKIAKLERQGDGRRGSPFTYQTVSRFLVPDIPKEQENESPRNYENPRQDLPDSRSQRRVPHPAPETPAEAARKALDAELERLVRLKPTACAYHVGSQTSPCERCSRSFLEHLAISRPDSAMSPRHGERP
jgi:hypothetical protein